MTHNISSKRLSIADIQSILSQKKKLKLSNESMEAVVKCQQFLEAKVDAHKEPIYGVTTGFGSLCNTVISKEELGKLQENLVMSHACGTGEEVSKEIVKLMLLLKIQGLSYGHSGIQLVTIQRLIDFYNNDVLPVIYDQGSLGASGDLSPLAHMALPLLGKGEVYFEDEKYSANEILDRFGWEPIGLKAKEGLALLNGTQFMNAYGVWILLKAQKLSNWADLIAATSLDAFDGRIEPFSNNVHAIRNHAGQIETAKTLKSYLKGSEIIAQKKEHVQDPYSFRCVPQVHGASKDMIAYVTGVFENEINAVTDNPTVFPGEDMVVSAGNFHGQPLAIALDALCIAIAELGSISERRVYKLISGTRGLPAFLVAKPGLNSGFMIPQYTAASIVSQNKQYCTPASIDSIDSSNGQEDHVSMGANAATKTKKVVDNLERILGIELLNAAQALEFRRPLKSSSKIEKLINEYRKQVKFVENDEISYELMHQSIAFIDSKNVDEI